jgi:hypothetical protein
MSIESGMVWKVSCTPFRTFLPHYYSQYLTPMPFVPSSVFRTFLIQTFRLVCFRLSLLPFLPPNLTAFLLRFLRLLVHWHHDHTPFHLHGHWLVHRYHDCTRFSLTRSLAQASTSLSSVFPIYPSSYTRLVSNDSIWARSSEHAFFFQYGPWFHPQYRALPYPDYLPQ